MIYWKSQYFHLFTIFIVMIKVPKSKLKQLIREVYIEALSDKKAKQINEASFLSKMFGKKSDRWAREAQGLGPKSYQDKPPHKSSNWTPDFMAAHREVHPDFPEGWHALPRVFYLNGWAKGILSQWLEGVA